MLIPMILLVSAGLVSRHRAEEAVFFQEKYTENQATVQRNVQGFNEHSWSVGI